MKKSTKKKSKHSDNNILIEHLAKIAYESQFEESWLDLRIDGIEKAIWRKTIREILIALERRKLLK